MKRFYSIFSCILLISLAFGIQAQPRYDVYKLSSGLSVVLNTSKSDKIMIQLYTRSGSIFENEANSGINALIMKIAENKIREKAEALMVRFTPVLETEFVGLQFIASPEDLNTLLQLIADDYFTFTVTNAELETAQAALTAEKITLGQKLEKDLEESINKKLWGKGYMKTRHDGGNENYLTYTTKELADYHMRYFHKSNNTLCFSGNLSRGELDNKLNSFFSGISGQYFDPKQITKILDLKPVVNFSQLVIKTEPIFAEQVGLVYQNPGVRFDRKGSYCANILAQILNNAESTGVSAVYDAYNYYGVLSLSKPCLDNKPKTTINALSSVIDDIKSFKIIDTASFLLAKQMVADRHKKVQENNPELFMRLIAQYRYTNDENHMLNFTDSLNHVSMHDMEFYVRDYFINRAGARYWMAPKEDIRTTKEEERLYPLDESIGDIKIMYEVNKIDFYGDSNIINLNKLIQWLQINDDINVQVNGFADEGEYNRVSDKEVQSFIDSIPNFVKVIPFVIKTKEMRPEMMRALKVMRAMYLNGIPVERMKGTSMVFTSDTPEKAIENRKCTFTLDKRMRTITLRESIKNK